MNNNPQNPLFARHLFTGEYLINTSIERNDINAVRIILNNTTPAERYRLFRLLSPVHVLPPLGIALEIGDMNMIQLLIENGADINYRTPNGTLLISLIPRTNLQMIMQLYQDAEPVRNMLENAFHNSQFRTKSVFQTRKPCPVVRRRRPTTRTRLTTTGRRKTTGRRRTPVVLVSNRKRK